MAVILVAEDEAPLRRLVSRVLTSAGHEVLTAANGIEAIALFRSYARSIDLVLTDMVMPVVDGYEVVRTVRRSRPGQKIICMSGYTPEDVPERVDFLQKPFTPQALLDCVGSALLS